MLAYGVPVNITDEYIKIGEFTTIECMKRFCRAVVEVFDKEYLRSPNGNDGARLLKKCENHGFSRMLESLACMHWQWKNNPTTWASSHSGSPTTIIEVVANYGISI